MKRIAAPMVGGMVTSTILTLLVIPTIYYLWKSNNLIKKGRKNENNSNYNFVGCTISNAGM
jgi:Cu(I)/Ag(I) efflux system membrane protein CusA/SilA